MIFNLKILIFDIFFFSFMPKTLPAGEVVLANLGRVFSAMGEGSNFSLEDDFRNLSYGDRTSVLAEVMLYYPGSHVCRTAVGNQYFRTDASLDRTKLTFTMLDALITTNKGTNWLINDEFSRFFQHETLTADSFKQTIEVCAGIGAIGTGYAELGVETVCYCDVNPTFCKWLTAKHGDSKKIIQGNIREHRVIHEVATTVGKPCILLAGIACQPYSFLGDRRKGLDERSESLPFILKMGYYTRAPIIVLECT